LKNFEEGTVVNEYRKLIAPGMQTDTVVHSIPQREAYDL
jgi:hypothetical protein